MALARRLKADGWTVAGTTRSEEKRAALQAEGIDAYLFSREQPLSEPESVLNGVTHLLTSIAPDESGDPVLGCHIQRPRRQRSHRLGWLSRYHRRLRQS